MNNIPAVKVEFSEEPAFKNYATISGENGMERMIRPLYEQIKEEGIFNNIKYVDTSNSIAIELERSLSYELSRVIEKGMNKAFRSEGINPKDLRGSDFLGQETGFLKRIVSDKLSNLSNEGDLQNEIARKLSILYNNRGDLSQEEVTSLCNSIKADIVEIEGMPTEKKSQLFEAITELQEHINETNSQMRRISSCLKAVQERVIHRIDKLKPEALKSLKTGSADFSVDLLTKKVAEITREEFTIFLNNLSPEDRSLLDISLLNELFKSSFGTDLNLNPEDFGQAPQEVQEEGFDTKKTLLEKMKGFLGV